MEHWELVKPGGLRFVWADGLFPPGTDSFLLSAFPRLRPGLRVLDLGSGTGLLSLLLLQRQRELSVTGLELLPEAVALAERTAAENGLTDRLFFRQGDLRDRAALPAEPFDLAVCNPPYYPVSSGALTGETARRTARAEVDCTLADVCRAARRALRWGGRFCLVHKPHRLTDLLCALREAGLEPKRLRMVCATAEAAPSLVLLEGNRGGKPGLSVEPPLVLYTPEMAPTAELNRIYFREEAPL
ncbi:tRNA1(Val) (adenine(37)-N6)-methyltransferase [uncultured Oscillibacter sp.]|uniref:tRNA1(Val) (adenine(37)-N6)-methyltransferase n=1 Tax=uncultured Oscillibacter sp. TaxID=876091 RepID=UPI0025EE6CFE|nr:methyltransferase [uncultured Oscillibacter sp.]